MLTLRCPRRLRTKAELSLNKEVEARFKRSRSNQLTETSKGSSRRFKEKEEDKVLLKSIQQKHRGESVYKQNLQCARPRKDSNQWVKPRAHVLKALDDHKVQGHNLERM